MPEQRKAEQTAFDGRVKALDCDLSHHHHQPDQACGDMQPVTADKGKKGREESAALRTGADRDHAGKLPQLQRQKRGAEHKGDEGSQVSGAIAPRADRQRHQSAGVARCQKAGGFDRNAALVEQLHATRAAGGRMREQHVSGKERREHDDVAQEEDPEAVANHDPLCGGTGFAGTRPRLVPNLVIKCNSDVHTAISTWCACSNRAICSAGISISSSSRNAKASMVRKTPVAPTPAIHQMCQISAKPVALFFGISIGSNLRSFGGWACCVRSRRFLFQRASRVVTCGSTAKFQAGGGEAVTHSSVRAFHGSAATFSCSRLRIETTSWMTWQTMPARMMTTPNAAATSHGCQLATS